MSLPWAGRAHAHALKSASTRDHIGLERSSWFIHPCMYAHVPYQRFSWSYKPYQDPYSGSDKALRSTPLETYTAHACWMHLPMARAATSLICWRAFNRQRRRRRCCRWIMLVHMVSAPGPRQSACRLSAGHGGRSSCRTYGHGSYL
jgi:hypothetical protein